MNKTKFKEKCCAVLSSGQFKELYHNTTKKIEAKIQRILPKIKVNLTFQEYFRSYPTGLSPDQIMVWQRFTKYYHQIQFTSYPND